MEYATIIIGAGFYGMYAALHKARNTKEQILVLEYDEAPFERATYINQARVHMGYHYPRSLSTAVKSAHYFNRFEEDYGHCIHHEFEKIYATSAAFSWTNAEQFEKFCKDCNIPCNSVSPTTYFKEGMCDGAFITKEHTYDAQLLKEGLLEELNACDNVTIIYGARIQTIEQKESRYVLVLESGEVYETSFLLNATYASVNQILDKLGFEQFKIKYELCEIILCTVDDTLKDVGITVMDGPFFSIMPFGKTGYHSLTSVTFTPHMTSYDALPTFPCQQVDGVKCSREQLGNCNHCPAKPKSAWSYMSNLAKKYLKEEYGFTYSHSLFSVKPILVASEIDDSRPTVIRKYSENPTFVSVLSGKINTVYDLDEVLENG